MILSGRRQLFKASQWPKVGGGTEDPDLNASTGTSWHACMSWVILIQMIGGLEIEVHSHSGKQSLWFVEHSCNKWPWHSSRRNHVHWRSIPTVRSAQHAAPPSESDARHVRLGGFQGGDNESAVSVSISTARRINDIRDTKPGTVPLVWPPWWLR